MNKHNRKKRFGQNFLTDKHVLSNILGFINPKSDDIFLEIGPGLGNMTEMFLGIPEKYDAIEIDKDLINPLKEKFKDEKNFSIINKNILDLDLNYFVKDKKKIRLIGNLPYNMSSPILDWCFKQIDLIKDMHFMFQKEFAYRCAGNQNTDSYGKLSVICNYLCKVDSSFVRFKPKTNKKNSNELKNLNFLLNKFFNKKRKKINKTLIELFSEEDLSKIEIDFNLRPDQLSLEDYISLAKISIKNG